MYRLAFITKPPLMWSRYYAYNKILDKLPKHDKASVFRQSLDTARKIAAKWKILTAALNTGRPGHVEDSDVTVDAFALMFQNLLATVVSSIGNSCDNDYLKYLSPNDNISLTWPFVQLADVHMAIGKPKDKASNYEGITAAAIKDCADT
jgi:hypothetical protein